MAVVIDKLLDYQTEAENTFTDLGQLALSRSAVRSVALKLFYIVQEYFERNDLPAARLLPHGGECACHIIGVDAVERAIVERGIEQHHRAGIVQQRGQAFGIQLTGEHKHVRKVVPRFKRADRGGKFAGRYVGIAKIKALFARAALGAVQQVDKEFVVAFADVVGSNKTQKPNPAAPGFRRRCLADGIAVSHQECGHPCPGFLAYARLVVQDKRYGRHRNTGFARNLFDGHETSFSFHDDTPHGSELWCTSILPDRKGIGGNREAVRLSGIHTAKYEMIAYVICGFLAGVGGLMMTSRLNFASPSAGENYEMETIAAVVIGGTMMTGGSGSVLKTSIGAVLLYVLKNGLTINDVSPYYQKLVTGAIIILAVFLETIKNRKKI